MSGVGSDGAEQRQLGANGVDVIDEFCEASVFDEAARFLSGARQLKLSNEQKLAFYALFKQATVGPCNTPKPSILSIYDRSKWNAWNDLGRMGKDEAIVRYVEQLEKVAPSWREQSGVAADDGDSEDEGGGGNDGMMAPQSRPVFEEDIPVAQMAESDKTIHFWAEQGDADQVKRCVSKGQDVNAKDEEGRTPLHWAVDRSHEALVVVLLDTLKANPNARDNDGATPLHYAALCEHLPLIRVLLQHAADPLVQDDGDESAKEAIEAIKDLPEDIQKLLLTSKEKSE